MEEERVGRLVHLAKSPGELSAIQENLKQYESVVVDTRGFIIIADYICNLNEEKELVQRIKDIFDASRLDSNTENTNTVSNSIAKSHITNSFEETEREIPDSRKRHGPNNDRGHKKQKLEFNEQTYNRSFVETLRLCDKALLLEPYQSKLVNILLSLRWENRNTLFMCSDGIGRRTIASASLHLHKTIFSGITLVVGDIVKWRRALQRTVTVPTIIVNPSSFHYNTITLFPNVVIVTDISTLMSYNEFFKKLECDGIVLEVDLEHITRKELGVITSLNYKHLTAVCHEPVDDVQMLKSLTLIHPHTLNMLGKEVSGVRESFKQAMQRHGVLERSLLAAHDIQNDQKSRFQQHFLVLIKSMDFVARQEYVVTKPILAKCNKIATVIERLGRDAIEANVLRTAILVLTGVKNKSSYEREIKKVVETQIASLMNPNDMPQKKDKHPNKYNASPARSSQTYQPISTFDTKIQPHNHESVNTVNQLRALFPSSCILADDKSQQEVIAMYLESLFIKEDINGPFMIVTDEESIETWKRLLQSCGLSVECADELFVNNQEFEEHMLRYRIDRIKSLPANHEDRDSSRVSVVLITDALLKKTKWLRGSNNWKWKVVVLDNAHKLPKLDKEFTSTVSIKKEQFIVITEPKDYTTCDFGMLGDLFAFVDPTRFQNYMIVKDQIKQCYIEFLKQITVPKQNALVNNNM